MSPKMIQLASWRLQMWSGRAEVRLSDGSTQLGEQDATFDRFVSNYVFDLLAPGYAAAVIADAHRLLSDGSKLCLVSLGRGKSGLPKIVTALWERVWQWRPEWVGGCRPVDLVALLTGERWSIDHHRTAVTFGITSDVLIASRR